MSERAVKPEIVIDTPAALARTFATRFASEASSAIAARGRFSWALPGGSVAETFLPVLARTPVEWGQVEFFWGDERAVEPGDPDSNYGLAKRLLLDHVPVDLRRVHRMVGEADDLDAAASAYEEEMVRVLGEPPRIDLILLGLGPDGHVCSLFPGHPLLRERARRVAAITDSPKPPPRRLTFTMVPLELASMICVAGFGAAKAAAIREALETPDSALPVALALRSTPRPLLLVDPPAASLLRPEA
ncbi:MAG: 6-phosphogluconolactonase [Candidatus Binatia bacterium]